MIMNKLKQRILENVAKAHSEYHTGINSWDDLVRHEEDSYPEETLVDYTVIEFTIDETFKEKSGFIRI